MAICIFSELNYALLALIKDGQRVNVTFLTRFNLSCKSEMREAILSQ